MRNRESFSLCRDLLRQSTDQVVPEEGMFCKMIPKEVPEDPIVQVWYAWDVVFSNFKKTSLSAHNENQMGSSRG